ncbi:recombination and DNA strand exchange inhibitor protein [Aneurinibacillus migulanus]|uniref:Endonuclease MutS2 n=1 Tax=Aneurinibacillus migulanus TaxID=47500 RepID=A0A0D1Y061_ANEMI|nr:endonuclease MutS2 [Aneurinibacillus migulanus]KIV59926.1 recombination and DNA strand exchange inhibitor protein [Aneurinibacillus migulanus]KIV60370.1 recombination and DNA strand exchange inhibitor protein [Aneurinibacillus migulanus]KON94991.1 recombination and DNA strand exchange inhibitor protein [Aneurinibacillus migulanus]KPD07125.1 recombination and DNA strand exchange inhibitor protein [Aneurinibacillus migulanus]MCP1354875.1 endonuclease MutS2 [Aneurinibacillus migulanus]
MEARTFITLEFNKVIEQLSAYASSSLGREKIEALTPSTEYEEVQRRQQATYEGSTVLRLRGSAPLGGIRDIRPACKRASMGGMLNPTELLDIASTLYGGGRLKTFIASLVEQTSLPLLEELLGQVERLQGLENEVNRAIDENGVVVDSASSTLSQIRSQIRGAEKRVRERLEQMTRNSNTQKMLQDPIVTIRNDRFVIPVKQEYRHVFGGIVHDQSASGATLFIEPQVVVNISNDLRELKLKEEREVEKILHALTAQVAEVVDVLLHNVACLAEADFIFAKAAYAHALKATQPAINNDGYLRIKKGRHPLIPAAQVVPIDVELGKEYTAIVVTGPNTGGKTVSLKTVGLFSLMAMSGLHIPAEDGSEMTIFESIYADIGDEQSIEQSLSTFSSHMTNISNILQHVNHRSLILFDELGAGTDPTEGAALAMSIIDYVHERGARLIATTHYSELKAYAYERSRMINASVEFDEVTLRPTYRLLVGIPGRSNAFAIAARLGLPEKVLDQARNFVKTEESEIDTMIASLEENQRKAETERREVERLRGELEQTRRELESELSGLDERKDRLYQQAEEEARTAVEKARKEAEMIIADLRQIAREERAGIKDHKLIEARKRLEEATPSLRKKKKPKKSNVPLNQQPLEVGDEVRVLSFNQKGEIVGRVSDKEFQVQIGIVKMNVKADNLEKLKAAKPQVTQNITKIRSTRDPVRIELDVRGNTVEDAIIQIDKYLDEALLDGLNQVSVIHGKGTGALGLGIQKYLRGHRLVKSFRWGGQGEGGLGATIVELK